MNSNDSITEHLMFPVTLTDRGTLTDWPGTVFRPRCSILSLSQPLVIPVRMGQFDQFYQVRNEDKVRVSRSVS